MFAKALFLPLAVALCSLALPPSAVAQPANEPAPPVGPAAPGVRDHALVVPYYLPHLVEYGEKAGLTAAEVQALRTYADKEVRPNLLPLFQKARDLEQEIGRAAIDGQTAQQLGERLDRLQKLKRDAAELHIRCVNKVRQMLPPEKYQRLVDIARNSRKPL